MVVARECFYFEHTGFLDERYVTLEVVCLSHSLLRGERVPAL